MEMDPYQRNLAGLLLVCGTLLATESPTKRQSSVQDVNKRQYGGHNRASQWAFYVVYATVMASDWLQGPYLYAHYREAHAVPNHLIPRLFATGLLSGALSAAVTGSLADRFGRRLACLSFCLICALSCALTAIPNIPCLFAGRVLGGMGTSLLFSVFEAWMVADFRARHLESKGLNLQRTFATMVSGNSAVAIGTGVASEWVANVTGTRAAPFGVYIGVLGVAALLIYTQWDENYGEVTPKDNPSSEENRLLKALANKEVLSLGLASTMFEGSIYLFIVSWAPTLKAAHNGPSPLPYGTIWAAFMTSMMASSSIFIRVGVASHRMLLAGLLAASTGIFYKLSRAPEPEQTTFWLFCAFEACVGVYWPCVGMLRERVVDDAVRARVYGILRIPLNVFVVVSLLMGGDGKGRGYEGAFGTCAGLFLAATVGFVVMGSRGGASLEKR